MNEYLLRHAISTVWCNPAQDRQVVYRLARLTPHYGVKGGYSVDFVRYSLPTTTDRYHVYQIGKVVPKLLGIPSTINTWISLADLANTNQLFTDLYLTNGLQFPRFCSYVLLTATRNLVFAVKINERIADISASSLYVRFYSNAYFDSQRSDVAAKRYVTVMGAQPTTQTELLQFQHNAMTLVAEKGGYPYYYVNGRFVQEVSLTSAMAGDTVEMVLDGSIKRMVEFPITDLPSFVSILDSEHKYILHYDDPSVQTIEFLDDVDIYLYKPGSVAGRFMGVYYHHNEGNWLRMLSHKDYSIPVERLRGFVQTHLKDPRNLVDPSRWPADEWSDLSELTIRLYVRHSGYDRPLQADSHRIQELYKLPSERILMAMTGSDGVNPLWLAEALEQCPYVRFMSADPAFVRPVSFMQPDENTVDKAIAQEFVGDVFGYHAAANILAKTPSAVYLEQGLPYADMAYEHWENATVFEFDAAGVLLEHHYHSGGRKYRVRNANCAKVEAITGKGGNRLNTQYGNAAVVLKPGYNYRLYVSPVLASKPTGAWVDITDLENRTDWGYLDDTTETLRWVWTASTTEWYGAVRMDDQFLLEEYSFDKSSGMIQLSVSNIEVHGGEEVFQLMEIPLGQLDVFLNERPLIENLDYVVKWPKLVLNNLEYLNDGTNRVLVRGYGFCDSNLERQPTTEFGFLEYGVLSNDGQYDLFTQKVQRIVVDGHYYNPADLVFEEDQNSLVVSGERNGAPYCVQTPPVVFKDVYPDDRVARVADDLRDKQVSDYMTGFLTQRTRDTVDTITTQYHVYSVFSNKILHDIKEGFLYPSGIEDHYSEHDIRQWCKAYEWLLDFDLINRDYNEVHVEVYPHWFTAPVGLNLYQYRFYIRVLDTYLRKRPDTAAFVYIGE